MKKSKKDLSFGNLNSDMINEVCLFFSSPQDLISTMLTNKHFFETITSKDSFGSENVVFPIGIYKSIIGKKLKNKLNLLGIALEPQDDPLLSKIINSGTSRNGEKKEGKIKYDVKRIGKEASFYKFGAPFFRKLPKCYYVRKIKIVESALLEYTLKEFAKICLHCPRIVGFDIARMPRVHDELFVGLLKCAYIKRLDICGGNFTEAIFRDGKLLDTLEELKVSNFFEKVEKPLNFKKLKKLVFKAVDGDCCNWRKPKIDPKKLNEIILADGLEELKFINCQEVKSEVSLLDFLKGFELKRLTIYGYRGKFKFSDWSGLENIEYICLDYFSSQIHKLINLRTYVCRGINHSVDILNPSYLVIPKSLRVFDISRINISGLVNVDEDKMEISKVFLEKISHLRVLRMCCSKTNFMRIIKNCEKVFFCGCGEFLKSNQNIIKKEMKKEDPKKYIHVYCSNCQECHCCGKKDNFCQKLGTKECHHCKRKSCSTIMCERCGKDHCPCTRTHLQWGFCGEICEYEKMCDFCFHELNCCDDYECGSKICHNCCSICSKCKGIFCEKCCKTMDEERDFEVIAAEDRVCISCDNE